MEFREVKSLGVAQSIEPVKYSGFFGLGVPLATPPASGQFFMARCERVYLRRSLFPCRIEAERIAALLPRGQDLGLTWLAARQVREAVDLIGPLGRGFVLEGPGGNLLLVSWGSGIASLLPLAEEALAGGWAVALLAAGDGQCWRITSGR